MRPSAAALTSGGAPLPMIGTEKVRAKSHHGVDAYLAGVGEPHRTTLQALRQTIRAIVPQAEEVISYGMPGFRLKGKMICGFAAFKNHVAYLPHSGSVFSQLTAELKAYKS